MTTRLTESVPLRLFLVLVTLLTPVGPLVPSVARADDAGAKAAAPTQEELQQAMTELEAYGKALDLLSSRVDPKRFDVAELAKSLGSDPAKCLEYVRDRVRLEPYQGLLRGSKGTLLAGAGNALDRAVLLGDLIRRGEKLEVRIVHGALDPKDAERLLDESLARLEKAPTSPTPDDEASVRAFAKDAGLDEGKMLDLWKKQQEKQATLAKELESGAAEDLALVAEALKTAGVETGKEALASRARLVGMLQDHFWLQVREGAEGKWQDLDPSWKDAAVGARVGTAKSQFSIDEIPKGMVHTVHVQFVLERVVEGKREEVVLLGKTLAAAACAGEGICVGVVPGDMSTEAMMRASEGSRADKAKAVDQVTKFQPRLDWRGGLAEGRPFDLDGQVYEVTEKGLLGVGDLANKIADMLSHLEKQKTALASVRMEWTLAGPGRAEKTETRVLLDRVPEGKRAVDPLEVPAFADVAAQRVAKLALLREYAALVTPGRLSAEFVEALSLRTLQMTVQLSKDMVSSYLAKKDLAPSVLENHCHLPRVALLNYELTRQARLDGARAAGCAAYYSAPSVALYSISATTAADGTGRVIVSFDVLDNPVTYVALPGAKRPADAGALATAQGTADTRAEQVLLEEGANGRGLGACEVFRAAREAGVATQVLTPDKAADAAKLALPSSARARIQADLARGCVVVAPTKAVKVQGREEVAWWRVDPATGSVLGILGDGSGGGTAEYTMMQSLGISVAVAALCMFASGYDRDGLTPQDQVVCVMAGLGTGFGVATGIKGLIIMIAAALGTGLWLNKSFGDKTSWR